jgi:hypothetical protein
MCWSVTVLGRVETLEAIAGGVVSPAGERLIATCGATLPTGAAALLLGDPPGHAPPGHVLHRATPFPRGADGRFATGFPDETAIVNLRDQCLVTGAEYLIVPATASGWLAERPLLSEHLRRSYRVVVEDTACRVLELRQSPITACVDALLPPEEPVIAIVAEDSDLRLSTRRVHRVVDPSEIEALRAGGLRFLVVPGMEPWAPGDPEVLKKIERSYQKMMTRSGVCEMFDLSVRNG